MTTFFSKNINLAHIKLISLFMMALCKARTVCFSKLSTCFDSPAKADSCLRRIQRFFSEHSINQNLKAIRILKHGRKAKSIFRYGLDIVAEFLTRGRNDYGIPIFSILSTDNLIFTPA